jgi:hypothetical protein
MKYIYLFVIFLGISCSPEKYRIIKPETLNKYSWPNDKGQVEIKIIRSFILDKECDINGDRKFADAFLSKVNNSQDTILILSVCRKTFDFLKPKYNGPLWLIIDSSKIESTYPKEIFTNIDELLVIKRYKLLCSEINNLKD